MEFLEFIAKAQRLALFGFVFSCSAGRIIDIISFQIRVYANLCRLQIGFVFSNRVRIFRCAGIPYLSFPRRRESKQHPIRPLKLALFGFVFTKCPNCHISHILLLQLILRSLWPFKNWLCFFKSYY